MGKEIIVLERLNYDGIVYQVGDTIDVEVDPDILKELKRLKAVK
jgi:hypothetical protein